MRMVGKNQQKDPRDLTEPAFGQPDQMVVNHIQEAIDHLKNHIDAPTLGAYGRFLERELEWVDNERLLRKKIMQEITKPLP